MAKIMEVGQMGKYVLYDHQKWDDAKMAKKSMIVQYQSKGKLKSRQFTDKIYEIWCKNMNEIGMGSLPIETVVTNPHYQELIADIGGEGKGSTDLGTQQAAKYGPGNLTFMKEGMFGFKQGIKVNSAGQKMMETTEGDAIWDIQFDFAFSTEKKQYGAPVLNGCNVKIGQYIPRATPIVIMTLKKPIAMASNQGITTKQGKNFNIDKAQFMTALEKMWDRMCKMYVIQMQNAYAKFG
jgi:hypothetical protein